LGRGYHPSRGAQMPVFKVMVYLRAQTRNPVKWKKPMTKI
jgi:hypothetical protein